MTRARMENWTECKSLGDRLKWVRKVVLGKGGARELAELFEKLPTRDQPDGKTFGSITRYENNSRVPNVSYVGAFAKVSGVDVGWLVSGSGSPFPYGHEIVPPTSKDPWAGSLVTYVNLEFYRLKELRVQPIFRPKIGIPAMYAEALEFRWPIGELRKLDDWRDQLLREHDYLPFLNAAPGTRQWSKDGAARIVGADLERVLSAVVAAATEEERAKVRESGWAFGVITEPSATSEDAPPPPEDPEEKEDGGKP